MSECTYETCTIGRDNLDAASDWGYCASQGVHYYGYKLHAVYGIRGSYILMIKLPQASMTTIISMT